MAIMSDDVLRAHAAALRQMLDAIRLQGDVLNQHTTMLGDILDLLKSNEESPLELLLTQLIAAIGAQTAAINALEASIDRVTAKS